MSTYYRYLDPTNADDYILKNDYYVWYYERGDSDPPRRCTDPDDRPEDAVAAVVASTDASFSDGYQMGLVHYTPQKDPDPPPPPPPWFTDLGDYLKESAVETFFNGVPRALEVA
ncbi:MAG TPA: hypothetical protein VHE35_04945 [Kofleriaceae bacterium]|nr:hypothetical protein [Kofleriaceae bacterium]